MGTGNSSAETRQRAESLAQQIGARHMAIDIDVVVDAHLAVFHQVNKEQKRSSTTYGRRYQYVAWHAI